MSKLYFISQTTYCGIEYEEFQLYKINLPTCNSPPAFFQVRNPVEYLSGKLRVGNDSPVAVVKVRGLIQSLAHFLAREEKFACKEWLVCLHHFHNPFLHTSQRRDDQLHLVRFHVQISCCFHHICLFLGLFDFVRSSVSTSSRL